MLNQKGSFALYLLIGIVILLIGARAYYYKLSKPQAVNQENTKQFTKQAEETYEEVSPVPQTISKQDITPTKQPKIYANDKFKFSLTIPGEWGYSEYSSTNVSLGLFNTKDPEGNPIAPYMGGGLMVTVYENDSDLATFAEQKAQERTIEKLHWQKVSLGRLEGVQTSFGCQSTCIETFLKKDNLIIRFEGINVDIKETNPILNTLQFN